MGTAVFEDCLRRLEHLADRDNVAVLCAEAVPWNCHRALLADALTARGASVVHILGQCRGREHTLTPWARVADGRVTYPGLGEPVA